MTTDQFPQQNPVKTLKEKLITAITPVLIGLLIAVITGATTWVDSWFRELKKGQSDNSEKIDTAQRKQDAVVEVITKTDARTEKLAEKALDPAVNKAATKEAAVTAQAIQETK